MGQNSKPFTLSYGGSFEGITVFDQLEICFDPVGYKLSWIAGIAEKVAVLTSRSGLSGSKRDLKAKNHKDA